MIRRILMGAVVGLGALGAGPATVHAHPLFVQSAPAQGFIGQRGPESVNIVLTEPLVAQGSQIEITGPRGERVETTKPATSNGDKAVTVKPRGSLPPGVYKVRWTVLGDDGHTVSGNFGFGVAESDGSPPPGAEALTATAGGSRGDEDAAAEGAIGVVARWLGILAASLLFAGGLLVAALRRRREPDGADTLRPLAPLAWLLAAVAASQGVIAGATAGAGEEFDLGLLTSSATGRAELARALVILAVTAGLALTPDRRRARDLLYTFGGAALLLTYAISGHVLADTSAWAIIDQAVHVLAAGIWLGGVVALVIVTTRGKVPLGAAARAFGPLAGGALAVAVVTGVLAAIREVDRWYFLRWSDYGQVVIAKALLVLAVAAAGGVAAWRARRPGGTGPWPRLLRAEAIGVLTILVLAATLAGLPQGRGQPLPAQSGTLFAGPALATTLLPSGNTQLTLAPARKGRNVVSVIVPGAKEPRAVTLRLSNAAAGKSIAVPLRRGAEAWSAAVDLPRGGTWFAYVGVDGKAGATPAQLHVGVPDAPGAEPIEVLAVADLTGRGAPRCRAHVQGLQMAIARLNAEGGLDGGRKVATLVLDSGGSGSGAARAARQALRDRDPIALAGVCGTGGGTAAAAAAEAGVPSIIGDPAVDPQRGDTAFRLAADPYAEGLAWVEGLARIVRANGGGASRNVRIVVKQDAQGKRRLAALRRGLEAAGGKLHVLPPGALTNPARLKELLDQRTTLTLIVDEPAGSADVRALERFGQGPVPVTTPPPVQLASRALSEQVVIDADSIGRLGVIQGASEVSPQSKDSLLYSRAVPLLFRGDRASFDGLRGYVTGLALRDAVRDGIGRGSILAALRKPRVFSDALLAPWGAREPGAGSPNVLPFAPQFISPTLAPNARGFDQFNGTFFPDGAWQTQSQTPLGLTRELRAPPLG